MGDERKAKKPKIENNQAEAQGKRLYELGRSFELGRINGIESDLAIAKAFYSRASDLGYAPAQYWMGQYTQMTDGMLACEHFRSAANQKYAPAIFKLSGFFCDLELPAAIKARRKYKEAVELLITAAQIGYIPAIALLSREYLIGAVIKQNIDLALELYAEAMRAGYNDEVDISLHFLPYAERLGVIAPDSIRNEEFFENAYAASWGNPPARELQDAKEHKSGKNAQLKAPPFGSSAMYAPSSQSSADRQLIATSKAAMEKLWQECLTKCELGQPLGQENSAKLQASIELAEGFPASLTSAIKL